MLDRGDGRECVVGDPVLETRRERVDAATREGIVAAGPATDGGRVD